MRGTKRITLRPTPLQCLRVPGPNGGDGSVVGMELAVAIASSVSGNLHTQRISVGGGNLGK